MRTFSAKDAHRARSVYQRRMRVYRALEGGQVHISGVLRRPPTAVEGADLWNVLLKVPRLSRKGIETLCTKAVVWPHRKLGELTEEEVDRLLAHLPQRCWP